MKIVPDDANFDPDGSKAIPDGMSVNPDEFELKFHNYKRDFRFFKELNLCIPCRGHAHGIIIKTSCNMHFRREIPHSAHVQVFIKL